MTLVFKTDNLVDNVFKIIQEMHEINDGDKIHHRVDMSQKELDEFIENLTQ